MSIINNVTGTNININDSNGDRIVDLGLQGDTTQETTQTGKNICPTSIDDWESGQYSNADGSKLTSTSRIRVKQLIKVNPSTTYYLNTHATDTNYKFVLRAYNSTGTFVRSIGVVNNGSAMTTSSNDYYIGITMYNSANHTNHIFQIAQVLTTHNQ